MNRVKQASSQKCSFYPDADLPTHVTKLSDVVQMPTSAAANERIFEKVEVEASIEMNTWHAYLENRLSPFLKSIAYKIPIGSYTVNVRFVVERNGYISEAKALNEPGYGLGKASEDAIREGPQWNPGKHNEVPVRSYHTQPITFLIEADESAADTVKQKSSRKICCQAKRMRNRHHQHPDFLSLKNFLSNGMEKLKSRISRA